MGDKTGIEELARDLYEADRTIQAAVGSVPDADWSLLSSARRSKWLAKAKEHIDAGAWTSADGWAEV